MGKAAKRKKTAARSAMSALVAANTEEKKSPEGKEEISMLSQGSVETHDESEISSIEGGRRNKYSRASSIH